MKSSQVRIMRRLCLIVLLFLAAALTQPGYAQSQARQAQATQATARQRIAITIVSVKPEMVTEFENMIKNETNPALAKGGAKWRDVWQTATFGDLFEYVIAAPIDNFAQYDGPNPVEKGLGKEGYAAWRAKVSRLINGVRTYVIETRPELSHNTNMTEPPKLAVVNSVHVTPGRNAEFENYIRSDFLPVVKQSGVRGYWVNQTVLGGDPNEYVTLTLHENYAELEKGPPARRVLGREREAEVYRKLPTGVVMHMNRIVARYVPELSYRPTTQQSANK